MVSTGKDIERVFGFGGTIVCRSDIDKNWEFNILRAWTSAESGDTVKAHKYYEEAGKIQGYGFQPPDIAVLRHIDGEGSGRVISPLMTEVEQLFFTLNCGVPESPDINGLSPPIIDGDKMEENIKRFIECFDPLWHKDNIKKELPHVMVMSTGRCGTLSLLRLFEKSHYIAYHNYLWFVCGSVCCEFMCQIMAGRFEDVSPPNFWLRSRAAEWLGAISQDRPMIDTCHLDTIFAPVFANLHPLSKFIYLKRDPVDVFISFLTKFQLNANQLMPVYYTFDPYYQFRFIPFIPYDIPALLTWYIYFTDVFTKAMGKVLSESDRFIEISVDKLFARDESEISKLIEFTGLRLNKKEVTDHFLTKYNEKVEKVSLLDYQLDALITTFKKSYKHLQETGSL